MGGRYFQTPVPSHSQRVTLTHGTAQFQASRFWAKSQKVALGTSAKRRRGAWSAVHRRDRTQNPLTDTLAHPSLHCATRSTRRTHACSLQPCSHRWARHAQCTAQVHARHGLLCVRRRSTVVLRAGLPGQRRVLSFPPSLGPYELLAVDGTIPLEDDCSTWLFSGRTSRLPLRRDAPRREPQSLSVRHVRSFRLF